MNEEKLSEIHDGRRVTMTGKRLAGCLIVLMMFSSGLNHGRGQDKVLVRSNFSDLQQKWEIIDASGTKSGPSRWRFGLGEFSGINSREKNPATALLGGEEAWKDYSVRTSLHMASPQGNLVGILFGYQGPDRFYIAGYNFSQGRFELAVRTPEGYELLGFLKIDFPPLKDIPVRVDFAGGRIRFTANDRVIFDVNDDRFRNGRFGLGGSDMNGARLLFGPVQVTALDPAGLPARDLQDLLLQRRGAELVSVSDPALRGGFVAMIDQRRHLDREEEDRGGSMSINIKNKPLPVEGVFSFPQGKRVEIHKIGLDLIDRHLPGEIEFLAADENTEKAFHSLGKIQVKLEKSPYQEFALNKTKARFLKMRFLSSPEERYIQVDEIHVLGFPEGSGETGGSAGAPASGPKDKVLFDEDFSSSGLDKWRSWDDPKANVKASQWRVAASEFSDIQDDLHGPSTFLLTGDKSWSDYSARTELLASQGDGKLTGPVFGYLDADHYYIAGYNFSQSRFELGRRTSHGYMLLAYTVADYPRGKWFPLRVDVHAGRILFWCDGKLVFDIEETRPIRGRVGIGTSALNGGHINLSAFEAFSSASASPPQKELQDLLASRRGAAVIYQGTLTRSDSFGDLLDHDVFDAKSYGNTLALDLNKDPLPQEAVFCFPQGRFVEIRSIRLKLDRRGFPEEIRFWVSQRTPKAGFQPLATIRPEAKPESVQEFPVGPVKAKYLKIGITQATDTKLLSIRELEVSGRFLDMGFQRVEEEMLGETALGEKEPNDSMAAAQVLPLNTYLGGKTDRTDVDYYKLALAGKPGNALTLSINHLGILRPGYALMRADGRAIEPDGLETEGDTLKVRYTLVPDDYYLRIDRPDSYLAIVFDDSSSMGGSVEAVRRILTGYLDNLGEGLNLQLMKYTDKPLSLSDFTHDAAALKQALTKKVGSGGGTDTFKGLMAAVESVRKKTGNRAVLAIFDVIDCSGERCLPNYIQLWDSILDFGIGFSTIGVQSGWGDATPYFGNSREQIFREIAFSSRGQFFHSPSDESVEESADGIFRQLTSPVEYRVKAEWAQKEKKAGTVEVVFEKGAEKKAARNIELILDASNSMWGQIQGEAKIAIAKKVLNQIIAGLPQEMNVGLRLYGHRYALQDGRACQDTELVVPIGPIDKNRLKAAVDAISPKGKTPLVHSVLEGIKDFRELKNGTVVLVSDGVESCDGDIDSIAPALKAAGLELQVNIVGFDIREAEARGQLEAIAESTGGIYLDAKDSGQLLSSLEQTLRVEFLLVDAGGKVQGRGTVGGGRVTAIDGTYLLRLLVSPAPVEMEVTIAPDRHVTYVLTKTEEAWKLQKK